MHNSLFCKKTAPLGATKDIKVNHSTGFTSNQRLPPFSLIRDFGEQNTRGNVSKISVSLKCY